MGLDFVQHKTKRNPILSLISFLLTILQDNNMDKGTETNLAGNGSAEKMEKKTSILEKKSNFRSQYSYGIFPLIRFQLLIF